VSESGNRLLEGYAAEDFAARVKTLGERMASYLKGRKAQA
jgi:hypothetical protein